ncbi:hypothetical protein DPMN_012176 [Dreissena polymorpha]|uniref:Uncharacterized protein n=1 Tax=Dreissena polymorpha TaxID=45954 RepID=A0A9D4S0P4_DREPO|nr:hypothetical protein DPMN_012176 [Dreissena polymorpha]
MAVLSTEDVGLNRLFTVCKTVDFDGGRNDIKQCSSVRKVEPWTKTTTLGDTTLQRTCRR